MPASIWDPASEVIDVTDYIIAVTDSPFDAKGDGATDDSVAIQAALNVGAGKLVVIPPRTFLIANTLVVPSGTTLFFAGKNAKLKYTGTDKALHISSVKNVELYRPHIDLSAAGAGATGIGITGGWWVGLRSPKIVGGSNTHYGISIETSVGAGQNFGAYMIEIDNPDLQTGPFQSCIRTFKTAGDTVNCTHIKIRGGWLSTAVYGLYLRNITDLRVEDIAIDSVTDCINIDSCTQAILSPGELGGSVTGYGINYGASCAAIKQRDASHTGTTPALGYTNNVSYTPEILDQGLLRQYASITDQTYYYELASLFDTNLSFKETVRGGGAAKILREFSDALGQKLKNVASLSGTTTAANNFRGSATFAAATTVAVAFGVAEPDANYKILLSGNASGYTWVTSKLTTGFTINCSAANSNTTDWLLVR